MHAISPYASRKQLHCHLPAAGDIQICVNHSRMPHSFHCAPTFAVSGQPPGFHTPQNLSASSCLCLSSKCGLGDASINKGVTRPQRQRIEETCVAPAAAKLTTKDSPSRAVEYACFGIRQEHEGSVGGFQTSKSLRIFHPSMMFKPLKMTLKLFNCTRAHVPVCLRVSSNHEGRSPKLCLSLLTEFPLRPRSKPRQLPRSMASRREQHWTTVRKPCSGHGCSVTIPRKRSRETVEPGSQQFEAEPNSCVRL